MIESLYLHIPFCISRCAYCDFATSASNDEARMDAYVDALSLQLRRAAKAGLLGEVKTIYLGGGTPTHLGSRRLNSLAYMISLSVNLENVIEFTCEANPESIDERMVKDLFALGIDRLSIGAQSFDDDVLAAYGRVHDAAAIERAVAAAKTRVENFSIDLICGGPGQSLQSWKESVSRAIELGARHLSVYPLSLEDETPMARSVEAGECEVASEEMQADMMLAAQELLESAGMRRYEVASYAYPGFEAKHNSAYWTGAEYLGLGAGAASMLSQEDARRAFEAGLFARCDIPQGSRLRVYASADDVAYSESLGVPAVEIEALSSYEAAVEDLMLGMRMSRGVSVEQVEAVNGTREVFASLERRGLVERDDDRFIPTQDGWLLGNEIYGDIWSLTEGKRQP